MHFEDLDLRVGKINGVKDHPNADRLYIISINLGRISRSIEVISGIKEHYKKEYLLGKKVIVLTNLESAVLRGVESNGMLLAAVYRNNAVLLTADKSKSGNRIFINSTRKIGPRKKISIDDFKKINLITLNNKIKFEDYFLKTDKEEIFTDKKVPDGCKIQ